MLICAAAGSGPEALVERLLKHGCDPNASHRISSGCLQYFYHKRYASVWAAAFGHEKVLEMLLSHGADSKNAYLAAVHSGQLHIIKLQLAKGVDPNCWQDKNGNQILLAAVNDAPMLRFLLEHGVEIRVDEDGEKLLTSTLIPAAAVPLLDRVKSKDANRFPKFAPSGILWLLFRRGIIPRPPKNPFAEEAVASAIKRLSAPDIKILLENGCRPPPKEICAKILNIGDIWEASETLPPEKIESLLNLVMSFGFEINEKNAHGYKLSMASHLRLP